MGFFQGPAPPLAAVSYIRFGHYRFHPTQGLTRGKQEVRVTPKSLSVLRTLVARPGEIVTKAELFAAVWPDVVVSDAALTTCIQELRRALVDDARRPKFIETVHKRGFRFLPGSSESGASAPDEPMSAAAGSTASTALVGRESALAHLSQALARTRDSQRTVVFLTGEPGIGKTALVDQFLKSIGDRSAVRVARADCIELHGAGEAYRPLLEALSQLCARPGGEPCLTALRRCAPSWLAQLPALQTHAERQALQRRVAGATSDRMLRELLDALEAMAARLPIVLCLEDLHWSDLSTLDWIASFARRPEAAGVLLVGTFRPGHAIGTLPSPEALADDLAVRGLSTRIALARLEANDVRVYMAARFPPDDGAAPSLDRLAALVHERTEGNPLFVVNAFADLIARRVLVARNDRWSTCGDLSTTSLAIPADVRRTIERQLERIDERERRLLEVAGVVGHTCAAAAIAAGAGVPASEVETTLSGLAKRSIFVRDGAPVEWPDGTLSATFELLHAMYREVLSARLSPSRRAELHRAIGERLSAAYGERVPEVAAELAEHFEHARDAERAISFLGQAAETARRRSAHGVATSHYRRALALLQRLPPTVDRDGHEMRLRIGLGNVLMQTLGWGAPEVQVSYARVRELSEARGEGESLLSALWNLWSFSITSGDLDEAQSFADRLFALAEQMRDPEAYLQAHHAQWTTLFTLGDLAGAEVHTREGIRLCHAGSRERFVCGSHDTGVCARAFCARTFALTGRTEAAASMTAEAVKMARDLDHPFTLAFALMHAAAAHQAFDDVPWTRAYAAEATHISREHSFGLMLAWATGLLGWSMVKSGDVASGLTVATEGVASAKAIGSVVFHPHMLGLLAVAQVANGLTSDALRTLDEAIAISDRTGERFYLGELHRLRGDIRPGVHVD